MIVYKKPFVSRESYFVVTGVAQSAKMEASKSKGYAIDFIDGKWEVREACYYNYSLRSEMLMVGEDRISIQDIIKRTVLYAVLDLVASVKRAEKDGAEK